VDKFRRLYPNLVQVREQFCSYDEDKDGRITDEEMEIGMTINKDFTREQAKAAFELADSNRDGVIDISEFIQLMFPSAKELVINIRKQFRGPEDVERKFNYWDTNKDGKITFQEMQEAILKSDSQFLNNDEINAIFAVGDLDQDGEIDFNEFSKLMIPSVSDVVAKFRYSHRSVADVKIAFHKYDTNGDQKIDRGELRKALTHYRLNFTEQESDIIFSAGDADGDGEINFEEFMALMCPDAGAIVQKFRDTYKNISDVKAAFRRFDKNRDGSLSKTEMSRMMFSTGHSFTDVEVDAIMNLGDIDGDGEIDLEEFVQLMSPSASYTIAKIRSCFKSIEEVKQLFKEIDTDSDGLLSREEMKNSPGNKFDEEEINAIYELGDANGDDVLDVGEFIAILFPSAGEALAKLSRNFPNIEQVKTLFHNLDFDNDGSVTKSEMLDSSIRFSPHEVEAIFALGDINDDGAIDLEEFIGVMYPSASTIANRLRARYINLNDVKKDFASIDENGDGKISREEMSLSDTFNTQEIDALFTLGDSNNDGEIDLEEFVGVLYPMVAQAMLKFTKDIHSVDDARFMFSQLDKDGDGLLSMEELRKCGTRFNSKEIEALFAVGDINNDGEIDINEFLNVMCPAATTVIARIRSQFPTPLDIEASFNKIDMDHDGMITKCEMTQFSNLNEQEVNAIFDLGDADRDGQIDLKEFIAVMTTTNPVPYSEGGEVVQVKDLEIYKTGEGVKVIIWCHDIAGFSGVDRIRQLADKLATFGYLVLIPNFLPSKEGGNIFDGDYIKSVSDWCKLRDIWVETLFPYIRDTLGAKSIGVVGVGWGAYLATRLSSYGEVNAAAVVNPSTSIVVEYLQEDLYELYEEVSIPQLYITARDDCPNEKQDGLAYRIFKSCVFGKQCEFLDLPDVFNGYFLEGDRSVEAIAIQAKRTLNSIISFFKPLMRYQGEIVLEEIQEPVESKCTDIDLASCRFCRICLEIRHQANKSELKSGVRSS